MHIVNVGYDSTNYYVLAESRPRLLIDVGFPRTLPKLQQQCQRMDVDLRAIPYLLATHYHPDHAGLAPELMALGVRLLVLDVQVEAVPLLRQHLKPEHQYQGIDLSQCLQLELDEGRDFLAKLGIAGQILHTPGHSDDSVSLILDSGEAFTGDLTHPMLLGEDAGTLRASWASVRAAGARMIYGGHGPVWPINSFDWGD